MSSRQRESRLEDLAERNSFSIESGITAPKIPCEVKTNLSLLLPMNAPHNLIYIAKKKKYNGCSATLVDLQLPALKCRKGKLWLSVTYSSRLDLINM